MREVAITGLGASSPFGAGAEAFWQGACSGRSAVAAGRLGFTAMVPGGVNLLGAAREAIEDAGLSAGQLRAAALVVGTTTGGMVSWLAGDPGPAFAYHGPAAALARALGVGGPLLVPSVACASGTAALGLALDLVRAGRAEVAIAGGADVLTDFVVRGFAALQALDPRGPARPFDRTRAGLSLGEGAAFLVVEAAAHARRRRALLLGAGTAGDAVHMTAPDREGRGAARAIGEALADARIAAPTVDFVSAHATGTTFNDAMEARAFAAAGVAHAPVHGVKGAIGHTLGAAGAFEALLCVRVLETGQLPPTAGLDQLDPDIPLDVLACARQGRVERALSSSSGFGGMNAAVVLGAGTL